MYKSIKGGDEAKEELDKQLVVYENELKSMNRKFIGDELLISKQMIQISFCSRLSSGATSFYCSSKWIGTVETSPQGELLVYMMKVGGGGGVGGKKLCGFY